MQKIEYFTVCNDKSNFMTPVQKSIYAKHQNKSKLKMTFLMVCWGFFNCKNMEKLKLNGIKCTITNKCRLLDASKKVDFHACSV